MPTNPELMACPFCGEEADFARPGCKGSLTAAGCWRAGHIAYSAGETREEAADGWNTRAAPTLAAELAQVREERDGLLKRIDRAEKCVVALLKDDERRVLDELTDGEIVYRADMVAADSAVPIQRTRNILRRFRELGIATYGPLFNEGECVPSGSGTWLTGVGMDAQMISREALAKSAPTREEN